MYKKFGKRALDIVVSSLMLLMLSPIMLLVTVAIRLEDGGAALFRQLRVGERGNEFTIYKFRSMPMNTGDLPSKQASGARITRVGRFIRRTNVDELPQLINIWKNDMSIVGPRPALRSQTLLCTMREESGAMNCKPGLTGLAQVNSYDGMSDTEKAEWDARYSESVSASNDLKIMLRTFGYLLAPPPVY